ncbi:MAG: glycogen debranching protein, partial [Gemmatimonadota bacterium]|nr:glycogen debranching protein [Gemmatimonadota bacterium]
MTGAFLLGAYASVQAQQAPIFVVTATSVRQGQFDAVAISRDTIVSSYPRAAREVRFRFSINGVENEFPGGTEHTIYLRPRNGRLVTKVYEFGVEDAPAPPTPEQSASSENGTGGVTFRLDLRRVLASIREKGYYDPPLGARIRRGELAHVYVIGDPEPLSWSYEALRPGSAAELTDPDHDGIYEGTVPIATEYARPRTSDGRALWARTLNLAGFPVLSSSQRIQDALYRLSLEELMQLVREDGALSAGAKWTGVWTRDISLSTILSLAIVAPDAARRSLLAKVDSSGRIIQDTGTGGSWPVSSDRMVWALAAWEIYASTGDSAWLRQSYNITRRSALADLHAVRDAETGLFNGESSFLDWREQSYPRWMQPADIYRSQNLGTNAVHYAAYRVLANMARALGEPGARWDSIADGVQAGMTAHLWQPQRGWYGQYRYGRTYLSLSPRAEGLGEALASIYGAASREQRQALIQSAPVVAFGTPTFWPYIEGERFYHNATIWPFVTAYWTWAAAEGGNTAAVQRGLDDATRTTALFLTNKENTVASTGHYEGTALNSDRQLWSVAGTLAGTYRLLFGMRLEPDRVAFRPMVPPSYAGERTLRDLRYRRAVLTVTVRGYGDAVS